MNELKELVVYNKPKSKISESIKNIRTNLQFYSVDNKVKSIMVTSSVPGEGKSFISANLACAFTGLNAKVLIIDCDLRKGRQTEIFGVHNVNGLSELLIDSNSDYKKYIIKTRVPNVYLLPTGTLPPNPSELLASYKNKELMDKLKKEYDIIVFDCPPVIGLSDSIYMTHFADAVIVVSTMNKTNIETLKNTKKILSNVNARLAGIVVNKIDDKMVNQYYNSYYLND